MILATILGTLAVAVTLGGYVSGAFFSRPMGTMIFGSALGLGTASILIAGTTLVTVLLGIVMFLALFGGVASLGGEK